MKVGKCRIYLTNWYKWVGFFWQNYDTHYGDASRRWSGFKIYYGFGALSVDF